MSEGGDSRGLVRKADELQRRRAANPTIRVDERQAKVSNAPDDARRRGRKPAGLARTEPAESLRGARMLFDDIEVLLVLSEAKSLSQATDQLYMSRPGLSQKIANIESKFGTTLVNRTPSGITLTKAGEAGHALLAKRIRSRTRLGSAARRHRRALRRHPQHRHEPRRRRDAAARACGEIRREPSQHARAPRSGIRAQPRQPASLRESSTSPFWKTSPSNPASQTSCSGTKTRVPRA